MIRQIEAQSLISSGSIWPGLLGVESHLVPTSGTRSAKEDPAMRRFALLLGVALSLITTSAAAQILSAPRLN